MIRTLDAVLGRITMYRLVIYSLLVLLVLSLVLGATGTLAFGPGAMLATLGTLMVVTYLGNVLFAGLFRVQTHPESSVITALLLFFILLPTTDPVTLLQIALAGLFASASKYLLAVRGRHVFNPAAVGAVWLGIFQFYLAIWWVGSGILVAVTAVLGLLVLHRTRRTTVGVAFVALAVTIIVSRNLVQGGGFDEALQYAVTQTPVIFFAGFMLSEPLTLPPTRRQQLLVAGVVAVLFSVPITLAGYTFGPETALIVGNLVAFAFGQRRGMDLVLSAKRSLGTSAVEFDFRPERPVRFAAGQYLELSLPHRGMDSRGARRSFSIASAPRETDRVRIGMTMTAERGSSFKRALDGLAVGDSVRATGVAGDFVLPRRTSTPLLLVAGGIGITPFVGQLAGLAGGTRYDIVVLYLQSDPAALAYLDVLEDSRARVVLVTRTPATDLPDSFENAVLPRLDRDALAALVPDIRSRQVYVSGPPALVDDLGSMARALGARAVRKDHFSGY